MQTIVRHVAAKFTPPSAVPAFDNRWSRAMSALTIAGDDRYLAEAASHNRRAEANSTTVRLVSPSLDSHHALVAALLCLETNVAHLPPAQPSLVLVKASPNGPNARPVAHSSAEGVAV